MELFHRRRRIGRRLKGKILPQVIAFLNGNTRGLGYLSIKKADDYVAQVRDSNNVHAKHIVKAHLKECSCMEWQHTGKPCQHALCLIIAQEFRNVRMEDFVDEYFSVDKFVKAYERVIEPLGEKSVWPKVDFASTVLAPIGPRSVGRQWKERKKSCLEGGSTKKRKVNNGDEGSARKVLKRRCKCPKCGELGHREASSKCPLKETNKRPTKRRPNVTKGWFPKPIDEASPSEAMPQASPLEAPPVQVPTPPSPPPTLRRTIRKLTPKKNN